MNREKRGLQALLSALRKSPINYFSDLYMVAMVLGWIQVLLVLQLAGLYALVVLGDCSIWSCVEGVVTVPLTVGGGTWMLKNCGNHWNAGKEGKQAEMDFPPEEAEASG